MVRLACSSLGRGKCQVLVQYGGEMVLGSPQSVERGPHVDVGKYWRLQLAYISYGKG